MLVESIDFGSRHGKANIEIGLHTLEVVCSSYRLILCRPDGHRFPYAKLGWD